jgi:Fic family protein
MYFGKDHIHMSLNLENAINYHYDKFPPQGLEYANLMESFGKATEALARYDQMIKYMLNSEYLLAPLMRQEAVLSLRLEGTFSSVEEILEYEADHGLENTDDVRVIPSSEEDIIETYLYYKTLKFAQSCLEESSVPLGKSFLKMLHQGLLSFGRGSRKKPGEFKSEQNYIGNEITKEVRFIPINPTSLDSGLDTLFDYIEHSKDVPLIKMANAHLEFEALHPFEDGNGRIGRMLIPLLLWKAGVISAPHFYISGYFEKNKHQYLTLMRNVSEHNHWTEWCSFFLEAVAVQADQNLATTERIKGLYDEMCDYFRENIKSTYWHSALDYVFINPLFNGNRFLEDHTINNATKYSILKTLIETKTLVITRKAAGRRPARYAFRPLLDLIKV